MMRRTIVLVVICLFLFGVVSVAIGKTDTEKRIERLIRDLKKSRDVSVRSDAAWDLGELGAVDAVPVLTEALKDSSPAVRANAVTSLGKLGDAARPSVPAIRELLNDAALNVVASAAWSLLMHGVSSAELVPAYRRVLEDPSCSVRLRGVRGLMGEVPPRELFYVALACSRESDLDTKMDAGELLRQLMDPNDQTMVPIILDSLKTAGGDNVHDPIIAIGNYKPLVKEAVPLLEKLLFSSEQRNRLAAAMVLGKFGAMARESVPALINCIRTDTELDVREAAIKSAGELGTVAKDAVPVLMEIAEKDKWPKIREAAMTALGEMKPDAKVAIPLLKKAYEDPDRNISNAARNALFRLDPAFKASLAKPAAPSGDRSRPADGTQSGGKSLFDDAGAIATISEKGSEIGEITIYKDFAMITLKDVDSPAGWSRYTCRDGVITGPDVSGFSGGKTMSIAQVDFSMVSRMTKDAPRLLDNPNAPISHVIFSANGKKSTWKVYVGEGMVQHGYVEFKLDGKVSRKMKF